MKDLSLPPHLQLCQSNIQENLREKIHQPNSVPRSTFSEDVSVRVHLKPPGCHQGLEASRHAASRRGAVYTAAAAPITSGTNYESRHPPTGKLRNSKTASALKCPKPNGCGPYWHYQTHKWASFNLQNKKKKKVLLSAP